MFSPKLEKYIEYGTTKVKILYKEKKFKSHNYELKYILEKAESDDLVVIFSGIPRPGLKARYNYSRTLQAVKANKLFILDDFGHDERGAYYLGKDKDFKIQEAVKDLVISIKGKLKILNTTYVGSSKGGYAAMYFGVQDNNSTIIAGSLQYLLGNYITSNERMTENLMSYVMGKNFGEDDVKHLNELLRNTLHENKENKFEVHLHYSDSEYTYDDHMTHLLQELDSLGLKYQKDVEHYEGHDELSLYFPQFLAKKASEVVERNRVK